MDVSERFELWLKSLAMECDTKSSQLKGDTVTIDGDKKKNKKRKSDDHKKKNGIHGYENDIHKNHGIHGDSSHFLGSLAGLHGDTTSSSHHDDLNEILDELTIIHESSYSCHSYDNGIHGDTKPTIDTSRGIQIDSAGIRSPKLLYADLNCPTYTYFKPRVISPVRKKSKSFYQFP